MRGMTGERCDENNSTAGTLCGLGRVPLNLVESGFFREVVVEVRRAYRGMVRNLHSLSSVPPTLFKGVRQSRRMPGYGIRSRVAPRASAMIGHTRVGWLATELP
jgi:hypothetical protein